MIKSYTLLPEMVISVSAWALAMVELILAIWLAMNQRIHIAALFVIALHFVYLIWLVIALARGLEIPNGGCFGVYWARPLTRFTPPRCICPYVSKMKP